MTKLTELKKQYTSWILDNTSYKEVDKNIYRIDTPFLDNEFDHITLYIDLLPKNRYLITDDGYTLASLASSGFKVNKTTRKRLHLLNDVCEDYGIEFDVDSNELFIKTDFNKFAISKHRLLQAISKVNDLFFLRTNYEPNATFDTVAHSLDKHEILHSTKYPAIGKGGITFIFDFHIPTRNKEEKMIRIINSPNDLNYSKILSMDVSMLSMNKKASFFAILDDVRHDLSNFSEIEAIYEETYEKYGTKIEPIVVSELDKHIGLLTN